MASHNVTSVTLREGDVGVVCGRGTVARGRGRRLVAVRRLEARAAATERTAPTARRAATSTHGHVITSRTTGSRDMSGVPLPLRIPKVESDDISVGTAVADPGGGPWPTLPPRFLQNHAVFRQFLGENPYFEQILGSGPPWCQNSTHPP